VKISTSTGSVWVTSSEDSQQDFLLQGEVVSITPNPQQTWRNYGLLLGLTSHSWPSRQRKPFQ
jgi:hypothetical protein